MGFFPMNSTIGAIDSASRRGTLSKNLTASAYSRLHGNYRRCRVNGLVPGFRIHPQCPYRVVKELISTANHSRSRLAGRVATEKSPIAQPRHVTGSANESLEKDADCVLLYAPDIIKLLENSQNLLRLTCGAS
jgi:hypothetical protein